MPRQSLLGAENGRRRLVQSAKEVIVTLGDIWEEIMAIGMGVEGLCGAFPVKYAEDLSYKLTGIWDFFILGIEPTGIKKGRETS